MSVRACRRLGVLCAIIGLPLAAHGADPSSVQAPAFSVGDSWIFTDSIEKGTNGFDQKVIDMTVERLDGPTMVIGIKRDGAPGGYEDHITGSDWSQRHIVNGAEAVTTRPFAFPMRAGKSWSIDYTDATRRGNQLSDHVRRTYTVIGWSEVTVPAGTYRALEVKADGVDEGIVEIPSTAIGGTAVSSQGAGSFAQAHRGGQMPITRRFYAELYYVPATKSLVKSIEEQYNTGQCARHPEYARADVVSPGLLNALFAGPDVPAAAAGLM